MSTRLVMACFALVSLGAGTAFAQGVPNYNIGDAVRESQTPRTPENTPTKQPRPEIIQHEQRTSVAAGGETLIVHTFALEGAEYINQRDLLNLLAPYRNRPLTLAQINEAAEKITAEYRRRGYLVARAYIPRQDASNGTLRIQVVVGKYGKVTLKNESLVHGSVLNRVLEPLHSAQSAIARSDLEHAMLQIQDLSGTGTPRLTIAAGEQPGTADFIAEVGRAPRTSTYLIVDNEGSRYTGEERALAGIDVNSPFGLGDRISLSGMRTRNQGLSNVRLAYDIPWAGTGMKTELAASRTTYQLDGIYRELGVTGKATSVEATFGYPIYTRSRAVYTVDLNLATRRLRDDIEIEGSTNRRETSSAALGLRRESPGSLFGRQGFTRVSVAVTFGHLKFDDAAIAAQNAAGADTAGDYVRLISDITGQLALSSSWSLTGSIRAQQVLNNKNLDGTEQLTLTGTDAVKAYSSVVSGDNGYVVGLEARYALPTLSLLTHSLGFFADTGRASYENGNYTTNNGVRLSDVGVGYYLRVGKVFGRAQVLHVVGGVPQQLEGDSKTRAVAQLGVLF